MHYFDNAATTYPKPEEVYAFMDEFYRNYGVNVGRGQFKEASIANQMVEETKQLLLKLFHCGIGNKQVVFTSSATEAINLVLRGLPLEKDDVIYTTYFEHNAVLRTLHYLENKIGIEVKFLKPDSKTMHYDYESIKKEFETFKPKVVIVNHASNAFGIVAPIKDLFSLAKEFEAVTICDMAQTAGLIDTDLINIRCDYAVFAGHKTLYGPFGIAGIIAPKTCDLTPLLYGGTGTESANPDMPQDQPIRFEAGSPNILAISGLNASLKWIINTGIRNIREKETENRNRLVDLLSNYSNIKVFDFQNCETVGIVSCVFDNYSSDSIGQVLSEFDIAVRTGLHCAPKAHEFFETAPAGTVRFSIGYYFNEDGLFILRRALEHIETEG
jgi:cysteine desulfurase family protein